MKGYLDIYRDGWDLEKTFNQNAKDEKKTYQEIVVALLWLIICILFEIGKRNVSAPKIIHIE